MAAGEASEDPQRLRADQVTQQPEQRRIGLHQPPRRDLVVEPLDLPHDRFPLVLPQRHERFALIRREPRRLAVDVHHPTAPSTSSRSKSACPLWRAYSSIMWL